MNGTTGATVRDYLAEVERALADLPRHDRDEIVAGLREHIDAALAGAPGTLSEVLDRLGPPAAIAAEARGTDVAPPPNLTDERWAVGFLSSGSLFLPFVGWLVGVVLVWRSSVWRVRDKMLAFLPPFGFAGPILMMKWNATTGPYCATEVSAARTVRTCWTIAGGNDLTALAFWVVLVAWAITPIVTALALLRRQRASAL